MAAKVVPFPSTRRVHFVRRQATSMLSRPPGEAELYLQAAVRRQRATFERKGVAGDLIESDARALEAAIRVAVWRSVLTPNGAA
jgi:hypothetical protein